MSASAYPISSSSKGDIYSEEITQRLNDAFLHELCQRPSVGLTEVRRDGKDDAAVATVIRKEFERSAKVMMGRSGGRTTLLQPYMAQNDHVNHMRTFAAACWVSR